MEKKRAVSFETDLSPTASAGKSLRFSEAPDMAQSLQKSTAQKSLAMSITNKMASPLAQSMSSPGPKKLSRQSSRDSGSFSFDVTGRSILQANVDDSLPEVFEESKVSWEEKDYCQICLIDVKKVG